MFKKERYFLQYSQVSTYFYFWQEKQVIENEYGALIGMILIGGKPNYC